MAKKNGMKTATMRTSNNNKKGKKDTGYKLTFGTILDEEYMKNTYGKNMVKELRGIHGIPYQFMSIVDRRPEGSKIGRMYLERIVTRLPLLLVTPGEPNYLTGFSQQTKNNLKDYIKNIGADKNDVMFQDLLSKEKTTVRYFTLDFAYAQYYQYVNAMLRTASRYLGIHGRSLPEKKTMKSLWHYDWSYHTMSNLPGVLSSKEYVAFYVESEDSINETISNSTTQSVLASTLESGSDAVNEIKFLMGSYGASIDKSLDDETNKNLITDIENKLNTGIFKNNRLIKRLVGDAKTVVAGGKIIFPEIWSDSSFSRNYSVSIKLRSPDGDKFSWYTNIFVPLVHLICLAAPRQVVMDKKSNPNAYYSPFLIRAFYKGLFSVEMGIVESLSISKGAKGSWSVDGLPLEVDVEMSIKDLYDNSLVINKYVGRSSWALVRASSMTDYIANSCGVNIMKPDLSRQIDLYAMQKYNKVADVPRNAWLNIEQSAASSISTFFREGKITF